MKNLASVLLLAIALAASGQTACKSISSPGGAALPSDSIYQLDAAMVDQSGHALHWSDQRGRPRVVSMFYSSCPYMCPLIIDSGKAIEHALTPKEQAHLGITLISLDPKRDTPLALLALATKRKLDPARWSLLQPTQRDVRAIAGVLAIRYRALADGEFNHTSVLILIDADGRLLARSEQIGSKLDPEFVAAVHRALAVPPQS